MKCAIALAAALLGMTSCVTTTTTLPDGTTIVTSGPDAVAVTTATAAAVSIAVPIITASSK
jgi:hypothetical protein